LLIFYLSFDFAVNWCYCLIFFVIVDDFQCFSKGLVVSLLI
jgi:hypothetical protein